MCFDDVFHLLSLKSYGSGLLTCLFLILELIVYQYVVVSVFRQLQSVMEVYFKVSRVFQSETYISKCYLYFKHAICVKFYPFLRSLVHLPPYKPIRITETVL